MIHKPLCHDIKSGVPDQSILYEIQLLCLKLKNAEWQTKIEVGNNN